jgi:predicted dehydrogenase
LKPIRVGLVGIGKIARDQHIPALRANPGFVLAACASRNAQVDGVQNFPTIEAMLDGAPDLDAVAICTPPQAHYEAAKLALWMGRHVLLEKPPCSSTVQLERLAKLAQARGRTLYQTWHSQHAAGVAAAARWLERRKIHGGHVTWKEDVRQWHPGQTWIWQAGGFGVFDPGINAISILTRIIPEPFFAQEAHLYTPSNCQAPIAASVRFATDSGAQIVAELDFRHTGTQTWDIDVDTDAGAMKLSAGGGVFTVGGQPGAADVGELESEYGSIYRRFAELIEGDASEVHATPLQLVADIFLVAEQHTVEPFED